MIVIILNLPPEEVPLLARSLLAVIEAKGQTAVDEALAALSMRRAPEPEQAPAEG